MLASYRDPSGHFIDTRLNIGFLAYDVYRVVQDLVRYADELSGLSRFADDAVRHVDDLGDAGKLLNNGDDVGKVADDVGKYLEDCINSFSADTPVMTDLGEVPISAIAVGDLVLAYNEETAPNGLPTGSYTVTAVMVHIDPAIVHLTIDGETVETPPEHPFYVVASEPPALSLVEGCLTIDATQVRWVNAGGLHVGAAVRQADGVTGMVQTVVVVQRSQPMDKLTMLG